MGTRSLIFAAGVQLHSCWIANYFENYSRSLRLCLFLSLEVIWFNVKFILILSKKQSLTRESSHFFPTFFVPVRQAPSINQIYHFILLSLVSPIRAQQATYYAPVDITAASLISSLRSPPQAHPLSAVSSPRFQILSHPHYPTRLFHS
jgi:hypothetical protein